MRTEHLINVFKHSCRPVYTCR